MPPAIATAINDGSVEATVKSVSPFLDMLFRVSASLEADASPLSSVLGLYVAIFIVLRGSDFALPDGIREFLVHTLVARFAVYLHPLLVLAFFSRPSLHRLSTAGLRGLSGSESLSATLRRAIPFLSRGDVDLEMGFTRELGGFLRFADGGVASSPAASLHPATWWQVNGDE